MPIQRTKTVTTQYFAEPLGDVFRADDVQERLTFLLAANDEADAEKAIFRNQKEKTEAEMMPHPIHFKKAFGYFGLLLGAFPPAALFLKFILLSRTIEPGIVILLLFVNLVCAAAGFAAGRIIGNIIRELEKHSWHLMLVTLPFIGALWGIVTGAAGGIFIFVIGAIFGAITAAIVGGIAFPIFTIFHRLLKKGDVIERNQMLPVAFGITFIISAYILGL